VLLYWQIGRDILVRQAEQGWGAKVIERLSYDLRTAFPDMKGFSRANLTYMRAFAEAWPGCRHADDEGSPVATHIEQDFRKYLECGILAHGFARARCADCGYDFLIAY